MIPCARQCAGTFASMRPARSGKLPVLRLYGQLREFFKVYSARRRLAEIFSNKFKPERVDAFGPDLACLEWLMHCGSTEVIMSDGKSIRSIVQMRQYIESFGFDLSRRLAIDETKKAEVVKRFDDCSTSLSSDLLHDSQWPNAPKTYIVRVDASDSAIANPGFRYFRECRQLEEMKLNFCDYFSDEAIREIALGRPAHTLKNLEVVLNPGMTDAALYWLVRLKGLRRLHFYFLPYVSNRPAMLRHLKLALPKCKITFPPVGTIGYGYEPN